MEDIDTEKYIEALEDENRNVKGKNTQQAVDMSALALAGNKNENLIQYQIETVELLEKLEHFYKGEYIGTLKNGDMGWIRPKNKDQIPLNTFGVSAMMEIISKYVDKNTTLSYYSEMRIYEILADLGDELIIYILSNYEKMGMDNNFKKTKFRLLIVTTLHLIESTYRKAISGKTIEEINQSRIITQSDLVGRSLPQTPTRKGFNLLNPRTWRG